MVSRIQQIISRISEIRHRFHLDTPAASAFGQPPRGFVQEMDRALAPWGVNAAPPAQNTLKPYAEQPLNTSGASGGRGAAGFVLPQSAPVSSSVGVGQPQAAPRAQPPPLPALPFDAPLEPFAPAMQPQMPGLNAPVPGLPPLGGAAPGAVLNSLPLPMGGATPSLEGLGEGLGLGLGGGLTPASVQQALSAMGRLNTFDQALRAYNTGSTAARQHQGVPTVFTQP